MKKGMLPEETGFFQRRAAGIPAASKLYHK